MELTTIRKALMKHPISTGCLEKKLGIPFSTLSHVKHGTRQTLKKEYLEKLSKWLSEHNFA